MFRDCDRTCIDTVIIIVFFLKLYSDDELTKKIMSITVLCSFSPAQDATTEGGHSPLRVMFIAA